MYRWLKVYPPESIMVIASEHLKEAKDMKAVMQRFASFLGIPGEGKSVGPAPAPRLPRAVPCARHASPAPRLPRAVAARAAPPAPCRARAALAPCSRRAAAARSEAVTLFRRLLSARPSLCGRCTTS